MKVTIKFNLPEEKIEHLKAIKANDLLNVITDLKESLRRDVKYNQKEYLTEVQELLHSCLEDNCINLDEFN